MLTLNLMLANAGVVTLTEFEIDWGATRQFGGEVTIIDLSGQMNPFQVWVNDFSESLENEGTNIENFIIPLLGSGITFDGVELYSVFGGKKNAMDTPIGTAYTRNNANLFSENLIFQEVNVNWTITTDVSAVPEPATWMLLLLGMASIYFTSHKHKGQHRIITMFKLLLPSQKLNNNI